MIVGTLDPSGRLWRPVLMMPHGRGVRGPADPDVHEDASLNWPDISYASIIDLGDDRFAMSYYEGFKGPPSDIHLAVLNQPPRSASFYLVQKESNNYRCRRREYFQEAEGERVYDDLPEIGGTRKESFEVVEADPSVAEERYTDCVALETDDPTPERHVLEYEDEDDKWKSEQPQSQTTTFPEVVPAGEESRTSALIRPAHGGGRSRGQHGR